MIEINDDETASRIYTEIDNATGDERMQMADALGKYGEKKLQEEYNTNDEHYSKMFMDDAYNQEYKGRSTAIKEAVNPDETWQRGTIQGYLSHRLGRDVTADNYEIERDAFSMSAFGQKNINDGQLFDNIKGDYEWQQKKTEALNDLHMQSVGKAINDSQLGQNRPFVDGMTDVFNTWQQKYPELVDGTNDAAFLSQGYKLYYDTINDLDSVRPQAAQTLTTLEKFTKGESDPEALQTLSNTLIGASPEERQKIYKYVTLAAEAGQIDLAGLDQFALNMGQAFTRGFDFVPQGSLQMQEAGVNNWLESIRNGTQIWVPVDGDLSKAEVGNAPAGVESDAWRQATVPEAETLIQSGQNVREGFKVVRELRNVAKTGVDPIRPVLEENSFWGTAERGAYGLAGSIAPMAATAVNPFLGALAYQATEYDRIMLENSDINPQFAQGLALVEGVANAAIDRVQLKSLSGKLPMFGRYLDRIKSDGIRRTVKIGANVVEQNLQEGAQDLIAPVLETAVAALREDMPDKDFSSLMEGWAGQRAETFFATLPLALIGGGVASFRDIKHPSAELNATKLRMAGFSPEQTTFIQRAENPEEYDARIQMEFPNRTPENIQAGEELIQQSISEAQTPPENSAKLEETVAKDGTRMWTVTTPDGKELLQTKDQQAALVAIREHNGAQILNKQFETQYEPEELRQMITDLSTQWTSEKPGNTLAMESEGMNAQQELEQLQAAGNASQIQELHNRIANSPMKDTPYEQINILGKASVDDVAEMVFGSLITINPNTRPENLREEIHHIGVKVAIKNGSVTLDTLRGWLDATEKALPGTFQNLVRDSEGDIVESLSQVQAAYENGKINADEETKLPPSFIGYIKNMMRTFAEVMRRAVALRGAFKDGALPAEYESFLADSVGLNQQARVDTASQRVAGDVLADTDGKVVFSRAQAQTNAGEIRASNATITGPANYSIAAHHGTPHKVDKFSTAKIGTGEGAQAYGWGLYFAEEKKVATGYRDALSGVKLLDAKGEVLVGLTSNPVTQKILKEAQYFWKNGETTLPSIISEITQKKRQAELWASSGSNVQSNTEFVSGSEEAIRLLQGGSSAKVDGNLYTAEIDVEPEDLLDWDKPLSEQGEKVKGAFNLKIWNEDRFKITDLDGIDNILSKDATLGEAYQLMGEPKDVSLHLLAAGIPGIRYLDGGSRSDGQGTYNYVAFDENLIRITEENGNRIPASQALAQPVSTDTNYSIGTPQFKGWFGEWDVDPTTASKVVDSDGKPMVVYHGTQRPDRVGDRFRKSRATSGPMAYFTSDPEVASSYATGKMDTSMEMPSDYAGWFKWKGNGMRSPVNIDQAWWNLSPEERAAVNERIYTIGYSDWDAGEGPIVGNSQSIMPRDSIDYELRQARGNGLRALVEMWLSSGSLFNQEEKFLEVLQAAGVKGATLDDPNAARSAVYPVYLSIKKPLDTADIPNDVISALEQAGKRKRAKQSAGKNADSWDKNTISGNEWMASLKEDMAKGTTHAWTRIPDWVTDTLASFGYDGIKDTGGKHGGVRHEVWIPFNETQVKSATGNRGTFDPTSANINYSIGVDSNDPLNYRIADGGSAITASQKIARDLGASSRAIQKAQPSAPSRDAELQAIRESASIPWYDIGALETPATVASEHQIWFKEGKVFKATAYGKFGHSIEKGPGNALPLEYLRRIAATNEAFDDSARIVGKFEDKDGNLGLIHVQDFIPENPENPTQPTPKQIIQFLQSRGFFPAEGRPTNYEVWINPDLGIEVTDLHPGNLIVDATGKLVPIDVIANKYDSTKGVSYSIASQSEIDRVNKALGGMNRGPDERLKVYQRAKNSFSRVMQENKEALDAIRSSVSTDTAPATERVEMDRAGKMADVSSEEKTELEKALQDNADTFLPRIEAAQTPAERKKVERDAKDRAKILEQGIRDKFAERKKSVDAEAKSQRDQIVQAAAAKDSASNARMRDKVRNTKLVNAIGELDGILKALPPEVRGRVGGFAVLANIGTGDKALADFFVQRIDMIDRQLERTLKEEYGTQFDALLERTKPKKAKAGEKPKGIGADIQSLFSAVREARGWNPDKVDGHIADLETQIAAGNLTPEEEAWLTREADLVSLAGDWKNADSSRRAAALEASTETWAKGMYEFVQKKIQEREARDIARAKAIKATGKKGDYTDRRARSEADNGLKGKSHGWLMDTMSWDQVAGIVFGHESAIAIELSDGQRKAEYTKIDAVQAKEDAIHDLFTQLAGGSRLEGEKLMWKMSQPSIDAGGLNLSQLEALSPTMLWAQEDGRRHMIGQLDATGNPTSRWHYNQQFIDDIESQLSPEAKAVRDFLWDSYGKGWFSINSVYRDLNGISLPRIFKYSPVTVNPINVPSGMVSDPVTGNAVSAGSISPGALRTRGTAIAQPNFRNVISTYIAHTRQMEHWKAFAPWTKEANGILRNRDVQDSIHEAGGEEANKVLNRFLDAFAQGGNRDASLGLEISQTLSRMTSRAAQVALVGRVGTLAIQFTQIGAASAELPMGAYVSRLGKLMTGNLSWAEALNSPYIQRRIKQMPPTVQIAMEGLKAGKPNQLKHQVTKVGQLISGSDALWTAGTYAMVYDYHLGQAKSFGYTGQAAEEYAHNTAERVTDRLAQPTRMGTRSIYEITATNPGAKLGWAFASEARKNIALLAYTKANRSKGQYRTAALGFVLFNLAMGAFIRNAWKDMKDDDDEELFDEKTWNWKRIGVAMLTEPLQGIPYLGDYIEKGINAALGQYHQSSDLINFERGVRAIKHIPDILDGERDMEGVLKDIDGMVSLMGMFNQSAAAAASLTHIASDFFGVAKNATTED